MAKIPDSSAIEENFIGLYRTDYIFGARNRIAKAYYEPEVNIGYHAHTFYEINFIFSGSGMHYLGDRILPAKRGDVFVIPPNHRHAYRGDPEDFLIYNLIFHPQFFEKHLPSLRRLPGFLDLFAVEPLMRATGGAFFHIALDDATLAGIASRLDALHEIDQAEESPALIASCECMTIIATLCEKYERNKTENRSADAFFAHSLSLIFEHLAEPLTIERLAEEAHLSRSSFLRKFTETVGMSPHRFIQKERIKNAGQLLKNTDMTIARIAGEVGFYDVSHFVRAFTAAIGYTPTEYRRIESEKGRGNSPVDGSDYLHRYRFLP